MNENSLNILKTMYFQFYKRSFPYNIVSAEFKHSTYFADRIHLLHVYEIRSSISEGGKIFLPLVEGLKNRMCKRVKVDIFISSSMGIFFFSDDNVGDIIHSLELFPR